MIESNVPNAAKIACSIMKRIPYLQTCQHRLHVLYLVHDVLQTEAARKDAARPLITAFRPYLVWMLRPSYQLAQAQPGEDSNKVLRLLGLWVERGIITANESEEMKLMITANKLPDVPKPVSTIGVQGGAPNIQPAGVVPARPLLG